MSTKTELPAEKRIRSIEALRVVTDDQRHRILSALIAEPLGARELAARLELQRTQVYYHLKLLEQHGFIQPAGERSKGRMIEQLYRATARHFRVDTQHIGTAGSEGLMRVRAQLLENAAEDLRRGGAAAGSGEALVVRELLHLKPAQWVALRRQIMQLVGSLDPTQTDGEAVELAIALFPASEPKGRKKKR